MLANMLKGSVFAVSIVLVTGCVLLVGCGGSAAAPSQRQFLMGTDHQSPRILVANATGNDVLEFSVLDDGNMSPSAIIGGSQTGIQDPIGIAVASDGRIAVADGNAAVGVFPRGAKGNVPPLDVILCGSMTVPLGAVFDASNNLYVTNERYKSAITAFIPSDDGCVTNNRVIRGPATRLVDPTGIHVDSDGKIIVADGGAQPPAIFFFRPRAIGNTPPTRVIGGPSTGLAQPRGLVRDASGDIYVANFSNNTITVYGAAARGDARPIRTIGGDKTQLSGPSGLAISSTGSLFVSNYSTNSIVSFGANASGNVAPSTMIAGPQTQLAGPRSIVFSPF
jgi:hypothetical protein